MFFFHNLSIITIKPLDAFEGGNTELDSASDILSSHVYSRGISFP